MVALNTAYDANGNIMHKLDAAGEVAMSVAYDAFGQLISGQLVGEYGFSSKPRITGINWYYYGFRYYDPVTGRWPNRDPIAEQGGLNLYAIVQNNPLGYWDFIGLQQCRDCNAERDACYSNAFDTYQSDLKKIADDLKQNNQYAKDDRQSDILQADKEFNRNVQKCEDRHGFGTNPYSLCVATAAVQYVLAFDEAWAFYFIKLALNIALANDEELGAGYDYAREKGRCDDDYSSCKSNNVDENGCPCP